MIGNNVHKYSVSAMCRVLQLPRQTYYYETKQRENHNDEIEKRLLNHFVIVKMFMGQEKLRLNYINKDTAYLVGKLAKS